MATKTITPTIPTTLRPPQTVTVAEGGRWGWISVRAQNVPRFLNELVTRLKQFLYSE